jgi:hypothetical protein
MGKTLLLLPSEFFPFNEFLLLSLPEPPHIYHYLEVDGASISIEAPDLENAEAAMKLAQRFQMQHPAVASQVTSQSSAKLKARVPKRPPRKRR